MMSVGSEYDESAVPVGFVCVNECSYEEYTLWYVSPEDLY